MNFVKTTLSLLFVLGAFTFTFAQYTFLPAANTFSHKKLSYITMKDGKEVKGYIKDLDRKKGLIEEIKIKNMDGKNVKINPEEIKHMYLPRSAGNKINNALDFATDAQKWDNPEIDESKVGKGYTYFETTEVMVKKKKRIMLMMVLNPHFSSKVKIYHDPFSNETMGLGVGGVTVAGGDEKSYYCKKGDEVAYKLRMKDYSTQFNTLFSDCPSLLAMEGGEQKWKKLDLHIYTYTAECN